MHWMCIDTGMVFVLIDTFAGGRTTKYQLPYMCCAVSLLPLFVRDTRQLSHRGESSSSER